MTTLAWLLYRVAMGLALLLAGPFLLLRRGAHYRATLRGRLGLGSAPGEPVRGLWLHAVSVGEVAVAATLARALPEGQPALVTTVTPTGQERARAAFRGRSRVAYLPFDLAFPVNRFFDRQEPRALVLVEGDYWPLVLATARRRGLPIAVVNGRVGDRSFARMRRLRPLFAPLLRPLFAPVDRFGVQTDQDRRRLEELGVAPEKIAVTGNLKYDTPEPPENPDLEALLRRLAAGRPILVAGSTMLGPVVAGAGSAAPGSPIAEEELVLDAFAALGGGERALLVLAPRHPERWDDAARRIEARGWPWRRRSETEAASPRPEGEPAVLLLDTLGELAAVYRSAAAAFIGGTLVGTGGHNPLEPARFGVPTAVGPSLENFRQMAEEFDAAGAWTRVGSAAELGETWSRWLRDLGTAREVGEAARALVAAGRGSVETTLAFLEPLLGELVKAPEAPETPETSETPEAPEAPETPEAPEAPETPEAPEAPEAPR